MAAKRTCIMWAAQKAQEAWPAGTTLFKLDTVNTQKKSAVRCKEHPGSIDILPRSMEHKSRLRCGSPNQPLLVNCWRTTQGVTKVVRERWLTPIKPCWANQSFEEASHTSTVKSEAASTCGVTASRDATSGSGIRELAPSDARNDLTRSPSSTVSYPLWVTANLVRIVPPRAS